jgi:hypothetical protein
VLALDRLHDEKWLLLREHLSLSVPPRRHCCAKANAFETVVGNEALCIDAEQQRGDGGMEHKEHPQEYLAARFLSLFVADICRLRFIRLAVYDHLSGVRGVERPASGTPRAWVPRSLRPWVPVQQGTHTPSVRESRS